MKKFTRIFALALVLVLSVSLLCGCNDNESIQGTWIAVTVDDKEATRDFLESLEFFDEEIALMDLNTMKTVQKLEFREDGTYEMGIDADGCREAMEEFFDGMMEALYNGRASLTEVYGEEIATLSKEEFNQFYAELFGCETIEEFKSVFASEVVDFDGIEEDNETGKYNAAMGTIYFTKDGASEAETAPYEIKGGKLKVDFADVDVEYTKE